MKILSYEAGGSAESDIQFPKVDFGKINLIVGNTGAGKTRLLNTIFNGALMATQKDNFYVGHWDYYFEHKNIKYRWRIITETIDSEELGGKDKEESDSVIKEEKVWKYEDEKESVLVTRSFASFEFIGEKMPKLSNRESSISLLREEELIKPIYEAFASIMRRNFSSADLDHQSSYQSLPQKSSKKLKKTRSLRDLFGSSLNLSCKLYLLSEVFKDKYEDVRRQFLEIFPFVSDAQLKDAEIFGLHYPGIVPVFSLKERHNSKWIPIKDFSSGMKKVLLILCDLSILPKGGCIYIIDEYENSLGMNAINIFPSIFLEAASKSQFIITSHHPYIIGNVPVRNWIVLNRKGNTVLAKQGEDIEEKYGKSKQKSFIKLINDPFYIEGVE